MLKTTTRLAILILLIVPNVFPQGGSEKYGTIKQPIVDSQMTKAEAFAGLDPACPRDIRKRQRLVRLKYYSFDGNVHEGQLVIDKDLVDDIKEIFKLAWKEKFPINSVIPISHSRYRKDNRWDDGL